MSQPVTGGIPSHIALAHFLVLQGDRDHWKAAVESVLDALESMARQNCHTGKVNRDYNGQVAGSLVTDSGALSAEAEALETLATHGRFRIVAGGGRMIVGYWPEHDPTIAPRQSALDATPRPSE